MCDKQIYITNRTNEQKQIKSKENITIIRALNNFGRVPEQHELLDEIENLQQELQRKDNNWNELKEFILNHYIVGHTVQNGSLDMIINKMKELEYGNK